MKNFGYGFFFIVVVLLSGAGFIYYTEGAEAFSTKIYDLKEKHTISGKDLEHIKITAGPTDVVVMPHSEDVVTIELNGEVSTKMIDAYELNIIENNDTLDVELSRTKSPSFTVYAINKGVILTVKVPNQMYEELEVVTTSGDIFAKRLTINKLLLQANSGDIVVENLQATSNFIVQTRSGDIDTSNSSGATMEFYAKSGDVFLSMKESSYNLEFSGKSGEGMVETSGFEYEQSKQNFILGKKGDGPSTSIKVETASGDFYLK